MNEATLNAIFLGLGVLVGKLFDFLQKKWIAKLEERKQTQQEEKSEVDQALGMYKDIIASLREDAKKLIDIQTEQEKEYVRLLEENAVLRTEKKLAEKK